MHELEPLSVVVRTIASAKELLMKLDRCKDHGFPDEPGCIQCEATFREARRGLLRRSFRGAKRRRAADIVLRYVANDFTHSMGGRLQRSTITRLHEAARLYAGATRGVSRW